MIRYSLTLILSCALSMLLASEAKAECRKVGDIPTIAFSPQAETALAEMKISRAQAFRILWRTAMPETQGCWAGGTGNFDGQIVSVGSMQWNFGQGLTCSPDCYHSEVESRSFMMVV